MKLLWVMGTLTPTSLHYKKENVRFSFKKSWKYEINSNKYNGDY